MSNSRRSNVSNLPNPDNAQYAISVRDSNGIQIEIRAHLRTREDQEITSGHNALFLQFPRATTRAGSAWVSKAITLH
ncbi:unnamed protein product [Prunus armeniaca]